MSYLAKLLAILAALLVLAGCGGVGYTKHADIAAYPFRYTDFDYKYAWKTAATEHGLLIDGVMKNVRYPYIDTLFVKLSVLNKDGNVVATASTFPVPQQVREGEECFFTLLLKDSKPVSGDVLQFQVHYTGNEGGHRSNIDWHGSFKVDALTGVTIRPPSNKVDNW